MFNMSGRDRKTLEKLCRRLVKQGPHHQDNIVEYYKIIHQAARKEFREDNDYSLNAFMSDCHEESLTPIETKVHTPAQTCGGNIPKINECAFACYCTTVHKDYPGSLFDKMKYEIGFPGRCSRCRNHILKLGGGKCWELDYEERD